MDEEQAAAAESVENINSEEGGVSADEVAQVMGLPKAQPETPAEEVETPEEPETPEVPEVEIPAAPETPAVVTETPEAPAFSLQVEDLNGEVLTLNVGDDIEKVLENFEPKNNGQVFKLMHDFMRLEDQKTAWENQQAEATTEAERAELVSTIQAGFDSEIHKLQGEKRLPLDGKIEERKSEIFKFMSDENERRSQDGRPLIQSFEDALDKIELQEKKTAEKETAKQAKEQTRRVGGMVGGSSAPASGAGHTYVAGSARNANDALRIAGLI